MQGVPDGYRACAGIVLFSRIGQIFLAHRRGMYVEHGWQMPQGGIDQGEEPLDAAYRELTEETAVTRDRVTLLGAIDRWLVYDFDAHAIKRGKIAAKYRGQAQRWFAFRLDGPDSLINIETKDPEFDRWIWTDLNTAVERIVPFKADVYREVAAEFMKFSTPNQH